MGVLRLMLEPSAKKSLRVILYAEPVDDDPSIVVPKSVPDFHSVGAIWVDPGDLEDLNENEYRNPDPPKFFPGVEEGTIKAHPLDTDAWNNLESIVKELTASPDPQKRDAQIPAAWDACERTYKARATWRPRPSESGFWFHAGAGRVTAPAGAGGCDGARDRRPPPLPASAPSHASGVLAREGATPHHHAVAASRMPVGRRFGGARDLEAYARRTNASLDGRDSETSRRSRVRDGARTNHGRHRAPPNALSAASSPAAPRGPSTTSIAHARAYQQKRRRGSSRPETARGSASHPQILTDGARRQHTRQNPARVLDNQKDRKRASNDKME